MKHFLSLAIWLGIVSASSGVAQAQSAPAFTFHKDVLPILQKNCQSCHRSGQIAPMSLISYEEVRPWARSIKAKVLAREMPPWHADPKYGRFANDKRLSDRDIATLAAWADGGAVAGDPKDAPPPRRWPADGWEIQPDLIVGGAAFNVPAKGIMEWTSITVPSGFAKDTWVTSLEILPSDFAATHHICVFIQPHDPNVKYGVPRWVDKPRDEDGAAVAPEQRPRTGLPGLALRQQLHCYLPGSRTVDYRAYDAAMMIPANSDFIFEGHYTVIGKDVVDRPRIGFTLAKEPPKRRYFQVPVAPPTDRKTFAIPPMDSNWRSPLAVAQFAEKVEILSMVPHMHNRGKDSTISLDYPDGRSEVVLKVPKYDYNWQFSYTFEKPIPVPAGTKIQVDAHYDNSPAKKGNPNPNRTVYWGDQIWEEMGGIFLGILVDPSVDPSTIVKRSSLATIG